METPNQTKRILVIGSANIDLVFKTKKLPTHGETVMGDDVARHFGGKGANQAVAARRLGGNVEFAGMLGSDANAADFSNHLRDEHLDLRSLGNSKNRPTGMATITVDEKGGNMIVVSPGSNAEVNFENLPQLGQSINECDIILLQFEIPLETNKAIIEKANKAHKTVVLNPSPVQQGFTIPGSQIDYLIINEVELRTLSGISELSDLDSHILAAKSLLVGVQAVIITRGDQETLYVSGEESFTVPTLKVTPVDTVGAGDTFAGAFAVGLARGDNPRRAISFANAAAALATQKPGAQSSMPHIEDLNLQES